MYYIKIISVYLFLLNINLLWFTEQNQFAQKCVPQYCQTLIDIWGDIITMFTCVSFTRTQNHPERVYIKWPFFDPEIHPAEFTICNWKSLVIIRRRYLNSNTRWRRYRILRPEAARRAIRKRRDQFKWTPIRNEHNIYIYIIYIVYLDAAAGVSLGVRYIYELLEILSWKEKIINKYARIAGPQYIPVGLPPMSRPTSCFRNANNRLDNIGYIY